MFLIQNMQLAAGNDPFRESRTPLDSIIDKLYSMPKCLDDMVQCELCEEWLHMSCEGYKTALEGKWLCIVCKPLDSKRLRNC